MVQCVFRTRQLLDEAIVSIKAASISYEDAAAAGHPQVWLNVQRTDEERRPFRIIKNIGATMKDICGKRNIPGDIKIDNRARLITLDGQHILFLNRDLQAVWSDKAKEIFTENDIDFLNAATAAS